MLNRVACIQEITRLKETIFPEGRHDRTLFQKVWQAMAADEKTKDWAKEVASCVRHPLWLDNLDQIVDVISFPDAYTVLAVDGSQIYPDRHITAAPFFLINAGGCLLTYGKAGKAQLFNQPELFLTEEFLPEELQLPFTPDLVDAKREEIELAVAHSYATKNRDTIVLFDGSLIFWHLESKPEVMRDLFLGKYLSYLLAFMNDNILMAGYISMPKSKELVNLVKTKVCLGNGQQKPCFGAIDACPCTSSDLLVDATLLDGLLKPFQRTAIFIHRSKISEYYPPKLRPCFFYLHTGKEIARVEIPRWVANNEALVTKVAQICVNQALKGDGYPVVLAEAHEQAVIKGNDRLFFYQVLESVTARDHGALSYSQKSIKKRGLGV